MNKFVLLFLLVCSVPTWAEVRRVWNDKPLTLLLPINHEVRVVFPTDVDVQVPMGIGERLHSLAPNTQMIYWTAVEAFEPARIIATAKDGKTVYILDVAASEAGQADDIVIEDPSRHPVESEPLELAESEQESESEALTDPSEILLTRFASQTLYAPSRLIPVDGRITPVNLPLLAENFPLLQSAHGERFALQVVGAWAGFGQYVTAILIKNITPLRFQLDLSRVRGNFTHITAQHLMIGEKGSLEDRTTLYVISSQPFDAALLEDSYAY